MLQKQLQVGFCRTNVNVSDLKTKKNKTIIIIKLLKLPGFHFEIGHLV